jgi:hypothetical protein
MAMPIPAMPDRSNPRYHLLAMLRAVGLTEANLRAILVDAAQEAERTIPKLIERETTGARVTAAQRSVILREIRAMQSALWGDIGPELREGVALANVYAAQGDDVLYHYVRERLGKGAVDRLMEGFVARAQRGLEAVLAKAKNNIPLSLQVYRTEALSNGWVNRVVNNGLLLGKSARDIAKQVRDYIHPNVPGGVSYAAFRLARTEINHAYQTSQEARYADEPWSQGMQWHLSGSHPQKDECDLYATQDLHGLGKGVYPFGQVPSEHPNGLCYRTPQQVEEDEFVEEFLAGTYDDYLDAELGEAVPQLKKPSNPTTASRRPMVVGSNRLAEINAESEMADARGDADAPVWDYGQLGDPRDKWLAYVGAKQGFDGLPTTVNSREADAELTRGGVELWRGVVGFKGNRVLGAASAAEIDDRFRAGAYEPGTGIYGNGFYFSVARRVGEHYAGKKGRLTRAVLRPGARVIDLPDLLEMIERTLGDDSLHLELRFGAARDPGRFATMMGYDAIRVPAGNQDGAPYVKGEPSGTNGVNKKKFSAHVQYVILNRTALLVEEVNE